MSNVVSALQGASFDDGIAKVEEMGLLGMITLRGDFADKKLIKAVKKIAGGMPDQRVIVEKNGQSAAWMSPDELLLIVPHAEAAGVAEGLNASLQGTHFLAVNVSDARAVFDVSGPHARSVMAKLAPVDFAEGAFEAGVIRRSRLAQIPAAFWMTQDGAFRVVCFRSVAKYAFDVLCVAAQKGSEVSAS
ncbi:sarcosine oxidase subunit gamma family protein [Planktotalea sp.]|uniref:sarcosine oxidase subunit gamma n=1 Tax=Planktotalea sp. TaxID=2029877 RepID=UPI003298137F